MFILLYSDIRVLIPIFRCWCFVSNYMFRLLCSVVCVQLLCSVVCVQLLCSVGYGSVVMFICYVLFAMVHLLCSVVCVQLLCSVGCGSFVMFSCLCSVVMFCWLWFICYVLIARSSVVFYWTVIWSLDKRHEFMSPDNLPFNNLQQSVRSVYHGVLL
jgi:hypothetical protein